MKHILSCCDYLPWTSPLKTWLFPARVASHSMEDKRICEREITACFISGRRMGSSSTHCFASIAIYASKRTKRTNKSKSLQLRFMQFTNFSKVFLSVNYQVLRLKHDTCIMYIFHRLAPHDWILTKTTVPSYLMFLLENLTANSFRILPKSSPLLH